MKRFGVILAACLTVGVAVAKDNEQASPATGVTSYAHNG